MPKLRLDRSTDMLGLIDIQPTFMPGGELPVVDGEAVVAIANRLMAEHFAHAFATQDWHPPGHSSFASTHPGKRPFDSVTMPYGEQTLWPDHALQHSAGAGLHPQLDQTRIELIVRKGFRREIDSYSAFFENDRKTPTGLAGALRERGVGRLFLAGLASDFCVAYSAEDAARLGFETYVIEDACRGIGMPVAGGGTTVEAARARLERRGVRFVTSADLGRSA
jgi:nicotinamidase/pyrazinamidase